MNFEVTSKILNEFEWNLKQPILLLYTQFDLLALPELQFKILFENNLEIPSTLQIALFGKSFSPFQGKGIYIYLILRLLFLNTIK